jgi:hypothetical protein
MALCLASIGTIFVSASLVDCKREAERQAKGGGLYINDMANGDFVAGVPDSLRASGEIKLSLDQKRHVLARLG